MMWYVLILGLSSLSLHADNGRFEFIKNNYLVAHQSAYDTKAFKEKNKKSSNFFTKSFQHFYYEPTINELEATGILLDCFEGLPDFAGTTNIVTPAEWHELTVIENEEKKADFTLANAINQTFTTAGRIATTRLLLDPTDEQEILAERQKSVQALVNDRPYNQQLCASLLAVQQRQAALLDATKPFFDFKPETSKDDVVATGKTGLIPKKSYMQSLISSGVLDGLMAGGVGWTGYKLKQAGWLGPRGLAIGGGATLSFLFLLHILNIVGLNMIRPLFTTVLNRLYLVSAVQFFLKELQDNLFTKEMSEKLPALRPLYEHYDKTIKPGIDRLRKKLKKLALPKLPPLKIPRPLQVGEKETLALAKGAFAIHQHRADYKAALALIGYLDAYVGAAQLIKMYGGPETIKNPWCFVSFKNQAQGPSMDLEDFHNPVVGRETAVATSLHLGGTNPSHALMSGVNMGGKSTIMKAAGACALIGQTFGIAPARSCSFTPYSLLRTYMNLTDNILEEQSLFKAELVRGQALLSALKNLSRSQYALILLDEICTGTDPIAGEALAYAITLKAALQQKSTFLLATHYSGILSLADKYPELFVTLHTKAIKKENLTFLFPYTLHPGKNTQHIAPDLLEKAGLPPIITNAMRTALASTEIAS